MEKCLIFAKENRAGTLMSKERFENEQEVKKYNPWKEVSRLFDIYEKNCLYDDNNEYVLEKDKDRIIEFNEDIKEHDDRIVLQTPPEPWRGNPLEANLIILSLNPGYDVNLNKTLAKLLQTNDAIRKGVVSFRKDTLNLKAHSFLPSDDQTQPISIKEAEDMLGGWYWTKRFNTIRNDPRVKTKLNENEFYNRVAVLQFFGYSSTTCEKGFPYYKKNKELPSQEFNKKLIEYLINYKSDKVRFLILRAKKQWVGFLGEIYNKNRFMFLEKTNKGRSQSITKENLMEKDENGQIKKDVFEDVLKVLLEEL